MERRALVAALDRARVALPADDVNEILGAPGFDVSAWFLRYYRHEEKAQAELVMRMIHLAFDPSSTNDAGENILNLYFGHVNNSLKMTNPKNIPNTIASFDDELVNLVQGIYVALCTYNKGDITTDIETIIERGEYKEDLERGLEDEASRERGIRMRLSASGRGDRAGGRSAATSGSVQKEVLEEVRSNHVVEMMKKIVANRPKDSVSLVESVVRLKMHKTLLFLLLMFYESKPLEPLNKVQAKCTDLSKSFTINNKDPLHMIGSDLYNIAVENNNYLGLAALLVHGIPGVKTQNIVECVASGFDAIATILLINGILPSDAESRKYVVSRMIHTAITNGAIGTLGYLLSFDVITETLSRGIENTDEFKGRTFFHSACLNGNIETVLATLKYSQELGLCKTYPSMYKLLNSTDKNGYTPLHYACLVGSKKVTKFLLMCGADPNVTNTSLLIDGKQFNPRNTYSEDIHNVLFDLTPMDCALVKQSSPILIECGYNLKQSDKKEEKDRQECIQLLLASGASLKPKKTIIQKTWELVQDDNDVESAECEKKKKKKKPINIKKSFTRSPIGFTALKEEEQREYITFVNSERPFYQKRMKEGLEGTFLSAYIIKSNPIWVPDSAKEAEVCSVCKKGFNATRRRHHCRRCGNIVCSNCLGKGDKPEFESIGISQTGMIKCLKLCFTCSQSLSEDIMRNKQALKILRGKEENLEIIGRALDTDSYLKAVTISQLDPSSLDGHYIKLRENLVRISLLDILDNNYYKKVGDILRSLN